MPDSPLYSRVNIQSRFFSDPLVLENYNTEANVRKFYSQLYGVKRCGND